MSSVITPGNWISATWLSLNKAERRLGGYVRYSAVPNVEFHIVIDLFTMALCLLVRPGSIVGAIACRS